MRENLLKYEVVVSKIIYHNKSTGRTVFEGTVLQWRPRKKEFVPTKERLTFIGFFFFINLGDRLSLEVMEMYHKLYGTEYAVIFSKRQEPGNLQELRVFLKKNVKGMTPKRTEKLLDKYGLDTLNVIREDEHALDFLKLPELAVKELREGLLQNSYFEEILAFLQRHRIDCRYAMPLQAVYEQNVLDVLETNPYKPYFIGLFDFKTADSLYLSQGRAPGGKQRCSSVVLAALRRDSMSNGNVYTKQSALKEKMMRCIGCRVPEDFPFTKETMDEAVKNLLNMHSIVLDKTFGEEVFYLKENFDAETLIVKAVRKIMREAKRFNYTQPDIEKALGEYENIHQMKLSQGQKDAVLMVLSSPIGIVTGGPGTGKTQTINMIIHTIQCLSPSAKIRICAPTGKAAQRVGSMTHLPATTIHRLLNIGGWDTKIDSDSLDCDYLIIDEFSMADVDITAKVFDAVKSVARVILVGDYNQLPSVGPGLVLRDFIASREIPSTVLKDVFRQAQDSRIVTNAHRIINQVPGQPINLKLSQKKGEDFYFIEENDPKRIAQRIQDVVQQLVSGSNYTAEDIQVLSPIHRGDLGVDRLNMALQDQLNPMQPNMITYDCMDKTFRLGDKVIHTKNNSNLMVFNGESGVITDILCMLKKALKVTFPDGRDVWYSAKDVEELELSYALTVHKTQGSEFPVIILPVHSSLSMGLNKNLIYTALTRAKKMVVLVGEKNALSEGLRKETTLERDSYLIERLKQAV